MRLPLGERGGGYVRNAHAHRRPLQATDPPPRLAVLQGTRSSPSLILHSSWLVACHATPLPHLSSISRAQGPLPPPGSATPGRAGGGQLSAARRDGRFLLERSEAVRVAQGQGGKPCCSARAALPGGCPVPLAGCPREWLGCRSCPASCSPHSLISRAGQGRRWDPAGGSPQGSAGERLPLPTASRRGCGGVSRPVDVLIRSAVRLSRQQAAAKESSREGASFCLPPQSEGASLCR